MKIAIEEMGFFGDCILDTAYFKRIKEEYPESEIDLYYYHEDQFEVFKNSPYIDNFLQWPERFPIYPSIEKSYDIFLNVIGSLSWSYYLKNQHLFDYRKIYFMGVEATLDDINVHWEKDDIVPDDFLSDFKYPVVFSAPGPNPPPRAGKNLHEDTWKSIFKNNPDIDFIQIGSPESDLHFPDVPNVTNYFGQLSIIEAISTARLAKFVMGCDSLLNHVTLLYDTNGIFFFGSSHPTNYGYDHNINMYNKKDCSPCLSTIKTLCCMYEGINNIDINDIQEEITKLKAKIL